MPSKYDMETFDDICNRPTQSLLFRLHSRSINATSFDEERKRLVASNLDQRSFSRAVEELSQNEQSFFIDAGGEDVKLIKNHINSLADRNREPSDFISLTLSLLWVLWKWKLLTSMGFRDDFKVIVVRSSELVGRAKLATEVLQPEREDHKRAYRFADSAEEVIVAKIVQPEAILGAVSLSRITEFIPRWLRRSLGNVRRRGGFDDDEVPESSFNTFLEVLDLPNDDVECIRGSVGLALAILAPMLVQQSKQEEPDLVDLLRNLVISQQAPEYGRNLRDSRASTEECMYVGALAAQVYFGGMRKTKWSGLHEDCTEHARRLLEQYRTAMTKRGMVSVEALRAVLGEYDDWDL